ncbi:MAG: NAD(P)-dependent oxidoreductase [Cyclonatronaceae bacterium]
MSELTIAADPEIPYLESLLPANKVNLIRFDPDKPLTEIAAVADALFIRTVTRINSTSLPHPGRLKLLATASAGVEHTDQDHLKRIGVRFASAPGCNANAVGEYVATAILVWCDHYRVNPSAITLGIVGCGNTGLAVKQIMTRFGTNVVAYDPPRAISDPGFKSASLEDVLKSDILSFHVPLTLKGDFSTWHWLDENKLSSHRFSLVINASRGGVVDETALLSAMNEGFVQDYIADVWENEPVINNDIASFAFLSSPHIAGYSVQAKFNGSLMVCSKASVFFGFELNEFEQPAAVQVPEIISARNLGHLLLQIHPVGRYHEAMRKIRSKDDALKKKLFAKLRNAVPLRDEYPYLRIPPALLNTWPELRLLCRNRHSKYL